MTIGLSGDQVSVFLLVLSRVGGLLVSAPVVGDHQVPRPIKVGLAILLAMLLFQVPSIQHMGAPTGLLPFTVSVLAQLMVGLALGYVARTLFFAVQTAGGIVSLQIGLNMAAVLNPLSREPDPIFGQLYTVIAGMTFLAVHGDLWLVASLVRSFDLAPLTPDAVSPALVQSAISDALAVTQLGVQIAMPIAASLFATNLVLGVVSRSLPQLNLFVLSMPLNLILGLVAVVGSLAGMILIIGHMTDALPRTMLNLLPHAH